ncbi:hypothetical protein CsatB_009889 [Cannabis sativa]
MAMEWLQETTLDPSSMLKPIALMVSLLLRLWRLWASKKLSAGSNAKVGNMLSWNRIA